MARNLDEGELCETYQTAWDYLSVSASAAHGAKSRFESLFEEVAKRGIREASRESAPRAGEWIMRDVQFRPDQEESEQLRHAYFEWQAYETIRAKKEDEYKFLKARERQLDALESVERKIQESSFRRSILFLKVIFHAVVFLAAIVILYRAL